MKNDGLDWTKIAKQPNLSEHFIREHADDLDWNLLIRYQTVSKKLLNEYLHKISMLQIFQYQQVPEEFIEVFITTMGGPYKVNKAYWDAIEKNQQLSESFIEKYEDRVNWLSISQHQELSFSFIRKHIKRFTFVNFGDILSNSRIMLTEQEKKDLKRLLIK